MFGTVGDQGGCAALGQKLRFCRQGYYQMSSCTKPSPAPEAVLLRPLLLPLRVGRSGLPRCHCHAPAGVAGSKLAAGLKNAAFVPPPDDA